ncbi:MAG TPA: hypothetical protein VFE98_08045 [Candidatus Bathyarchaeia archaeon]|nr:hypothetical protein [Candidatus Bathyarchaeia archaeon]
MREAFLTVGTLLIFAGCMGAISATIPYAGAGVAITEAAVTQVYLAVGISTIIALIGAAIVLRYR